MTPRQPVLFLLFQWASARLTQSSGLPGPPAGGRRARTVTLTGRRAPLSPPQDSLQHQVWSLYRLKIRDVVVMGQLCRFFFNVLTSKCVNKDSYVDLKKKMCWKAKVLCVCVRNCYVCVFAYIYFLSIGPGMFCELLVLVESRLCSINFPTSMSFICDQ